jgi:hypothetical protein
MEYINALRAGTTSKSSRFETYYWQSWFEYPVLQRAYAGFFLWNSGLDGVMPYVYQSPSHSSYCDPFDDFDTISDYNYRDMFTTYPSSDGPIPTTKWEAFREGYDDIRYLTTLFKLLEDENPTRKQQIIDEVNEELEQYYDLGDFDSTTGMGARFQISRELIVDKILQIQ